MVATDALPFHFARARPVPHSVTERSRPMTRLLLAATTVLGITALGAMVAPAPAHAVVCANGVYRAGCTGPNGTAVVNKAPAYRAPVTAYHGGRVNCASGPYRAGCAGPNGAVVRRY